MADSALSRRVSELAGVALFAASLIWMIALLTFTPSDPVWFFTTAPPGEVSNFAGLAQFIKPKPPIEASQLIPGRTRSAATVAAVKATQSI